MQYFKFKVATHCHAYTKHFNWCKRPYGIRPLVIGKIKDSYVLASETCALDIIGAKYVRDVENGEIVLLKIMN